MVAMGLHKHFPVEDLVVLAASRMLCLAGLVGFSLPAVKLIRLKDTMAGVRGIVVVAALLFALDAVMLAAVLLRGADDSQWSAWMGVPFMATFYGAFVVIPLAITAALEGTRFAKPLWKNSRTSENLMSWRRSDDSKHDA